MNVISHRGGKGLAPENSLESIIIADKLVPAMIEFDVQFTKDNIPVLFHNKRSKSGSLISELSYDNLILEHNELAKLEDALNNINKSQALVELKQPGTAQKIITYLFVNVVVTSFLETEVSYLKKHGKNQLFLMQRMHPFGLFHKAKKNRLNGIGINKNWLLTLPFYYYLCQKNNMLLYTYTLNNVTLAKLLSWLMPRIYICTDRPDKLLGQ